MTDRGGNVSGHYFGFSSSNNSIAMDSKSPTSSADSPEFEDIPVSKSLMQQAYQVYHQNRGLLLIASSTFTGSLMMVVVKLMSNQDATLSESERAEPHVPPLQLIAVRMMLTYFLCIGWMYYDKVPYPITGPPGVRLWLSLRGGAGFLGLFGAYYGLQYLSLSDSTAIGFLAPFATAGFGRLLLNEAYSRKEVYASLASFLGVILIARPSFLFGDPTTLLKLDVTPTDMRSHQHGATGIADHGIVVGLQGAATHTQQHPETMRLVAIVVQLIGVIGAALAYVAMRRVGSCTHVMHSITYFNGWCLVIATLCSVVLGVPWVLPDLKLAMGMVAVALLGFCGQILSTMGFQRETAGRGTLGLYLAIVFSWIFEEAIFHHQPTLLSVVGMAIIISSAVYVAVSKPTGSMPTTAQQSEDEEVGLMSMNDHEDDNTTLAESPVVEAKLLDRGPQHHHVDARDVKIEQKP